MFGNRRSHKLFSRLLQKVEHQKGISEYDLFVHKLKPALYIYPRDKGFYELKKQGFPFVQLPHRGRVFYHSDDQLPKIQEATNRNDHTGIPYYSEKLGVILGIPRIAANDFAVRKPPMPQDKRVFITYHGITFAVHEENVSEALHDIQDRIPIPPYFNTRKYAYKRVYQQVISIPI